MNTNWREVGREEFYRVVGPQDVHPVPTGKWPYTSNFKDRNGNVRAKIESTLPPGKALPVARYYLPGF